MKPLLRKEKGLKSSGETKPNICNYCLEFLSKKKKLALFRNFEQQFNIVDSSVGCNMIR